MTRATVKIDTERCKGCAVCVEACPKHLITLSHHAVNRKGYPFAQQDDDSHCTGCAACGIVCPDGCIEVYKTKLHD